MRKFLIILSILLMSFSAEAVIKVTQMTPDTAPTSDDLVMTINAPGTTPASRKVTLSDLTKGLAVGTTSAVGTLQLATTAEAVTGTNTAKAVTPEGLSAMFAAPKAIGTTTPAAGTFTTITTVGATNNNYVSITNNAGGRAPTASAYELYPDAGVWKMNTNGVETSILNHDGTDINAGALNFPTTGIISGKIGVITKATAYTLGTDAAREAYGYMLVLTAAAIETLPAAVLGMSGCTYANTTGKVSVKAGASDHWTMTDGTPLTNGYKISATGTGSFVCWAVLGANNIFILSSRGTWAADGS